MSDVPHDGGSPVVRNILMVAGVVYLIGTVVFMVMAQGRMNDMEKKQAAAQAELVKKDDRIQRTDESLTQRAGGPRRNEPQRVEQEGPGASSQRA